MAPVVGEPAVGPPPAAPAPPTPAAPAVPASLSAGKARTRSFRHHSSLITPI
jgi:hypothetical protein